MKLLLSPHNYDDALFATYLILRERPLVLTCFDGARKRNAPTPADRVAESIAAMETLGVKYAHLCMPLAYADWQEATAQRISLMKIDEPEQVWAPLPELHGHRHHNRLGELASRLWPGRISFYRTCFHTGETVDDVYRTASHGTLVKPEPGWEEFKRRALACHPSQIADEGTGTHFERPLDEWEVPTLRLNLGGEINRIPGFVNMDVSYGWRHEDGLGMWGSGSVEAITESHSLMYVALQDWPQCFAEMARVLQHGGTLRITQDAIGSPGSTRRHIRPKAKVATAAAEVLEHCQAVGLTARVVAPDETYFTDRTLIQQNYGRPPDVFHVEAVKERA